MKIKTIIPVTTDKWDKNVMADYDRIKGPDTRVDVVRIQHGPEAVQSEYDEARSAYYVVQEASLSTEQGYDAVIIYCFSDPGLSASRERATIPVLGLGESSQLIAMGLADRIGIITTLDQSVNRIRRKLQARGISARFPGLRALNIPVLDYDQADRVAARVMETTRLLVEEDGAEAIILGCGSLFGFKERIQDAFGLPAVEPAGATLKYAELVAGLGLSHSKRSFMTPLPVVEH